jgi:hypothetical protein
MTEDKLRPTDNTKFSKDQERAADDRDAATCPDLDDITISDEVSERACGSTGPKRRWTS